MTDPEAAREFLGVHIGQLRDPYEIPGMRDAVERLHRALQDGETIGIFGDYDVDGVSGTALLTRFLKTPERPVPTYIPHRTKEGYGLNEKGIQVLADQGVRLLVTIDTGTTAHVSIAQARRRGMDVIVLDHHVPDASLPEGAIVVNPLMCERPNPLASVGVTFKTVWALAERYQKSDSQKKQFAEFLPFALMAAALGTIADVCPMQGDNRVLVSLGLQELNERPSTGLAAIQRSAGLTRRTLSAGDIAFKFAPRLNAAGRMLTAATALEILLTDDAARASQLAAELELANRKRRQVEDGILKDALALLEASGDGERERVIVLADDRWHSGVVGIVATRLVERTGRPTFLIGMDGKQGRGSARTIDAFNLKDAIARCEDLLISGGGHAMAGGLTIARDKIEPFTARMREIANEMIRDEDLRLSLKIDLEIALDEVVPGLHRELNRLAPFGITNPRPVLCARDLRIAGVPKLMGRDGRHLSFYAAQGEASLRAVGWNLSDRYEELLDAESVDLAFTIESNTWQGKTNLELILKDIRVTR